MVPEGDTIFRLAARLRPLLVGQRLRHLRSRKHGEVTRLASSEVEAIDARGKHLLIALDGGYTLRVHLGIRGRCHLYREGERWRRPGWRATLVLQHDGGEVVFFDAPQVQIGRTKLMAGDRALAQLGPDLLSASCDLQEVLRRACAGANAVEPIAHVLLDQRVAAGIGNVFKCEVLFIARVHPWQPTADVPADKLRALFERARTLLAANTGPGPRVTVPPALRERGARVWVYRRVGRPCFRCRAIIESRQSGTLARTTYFCPRCQPAPHNESR